MENVSIHLFLILHGLRFVLLGDSMLCRLWSRVHRHARLNTVLCHGGQPITRLDNAIARKYRYVLPRSNAILLIGTNDLHSDENIDLDTFKARYNHLRDTILKSNITRLIVLSIPPIALLMQPTQNKRHQEFKVFWR